MWSRHSATGFIWAKLPVQSGVPAMAITSDHFVEMMETITHTPQDTIEKVDAERLVKLALALRDLLVD